VKDLHLDNYDKTLTIAKNGLQFSKLYLTHDVCYDKLNIYICNHNL
jgi:hypothetical protein